MWDTSIPCFTMTKCACLTLIYLLSWMGGVMSGTVMSEFRIYENKSPVASAVIQSSEVISLVECASMCNVNPFCKSFTVNCIELLSAKQMCHHHSLSVSSDLDLAASELCYVQKVDVSVVPTPSTTETTTTLATPVIDIVYGPRNMCPGGSTNDDFLVLTPDGVYVYDEVNDLTSAPCDGPVPFTSIFKNYPSIPTIDMVSGLLIHQTSNVELYADGTVYKWQVESGQLSSVLGSQSFSGHLGTTELDNVDFIWAAERLGSSAERHFYLGGGLFIMESSQHGTREFTKTEQVYDVNGFDMNPWSEIPTDTAAVTGYGIEPNKDFALIDSSGNVYVYHLDHTSDPSYHNNPTKSLVLQGRIQF